MKLNLIKKTLLLVIFSQIIACSGINVSQDYEQDYNFSALKTFAWKPMAEDGYGIEDNELVDKRIREAIVNQLVLKSYVLMESGTPDFYISYELTVKQKISSNSVSGGVSFGRSSYGRFGGVGLSTGSNVYSYDQGTLLIDITEVLEGRLVWRGISTQSVSDHSSPTESVENINETVEAMLKLFPPK